MGIIIVSTAFEGSEDAYGNDNVEAISDIVALREAAEQEKILRLELPEWIVNEGVPSKAAWVSAF